MGKDSIVVSIFVAVIGGILLLIFVNPITDIITPPEAIPVAQYGEKVFPPSILLQSYNDYTDDVSIKIKNMGDDGAFFVTFFSRELLSRASDEEEFKKNSTKLWILNKGQIQDFNFKIKKENVSNNFRNFTIHITYGCYEEVIGMKFYCKQHKRCGNYQQGTNGFDFRLINQTCS